jgi:serine/threonine protein kinase
MCDFPTEPGPFIGDVGLTVFSIFGMATTLFSLSLSLAPARRYTILSHYDVLHRLGVLHNDVESRHIREAALDGEENAVRIIDFSNARFKDDYDEKTWRKLCKSEMSDVEAMIRLGRRGDEGRIG